MSIAKWTAEVRSRLEAATPGPWAWLQSAGKTIIRAKKPRTQADMLFMYPYKDRHESELWSGQDAELIANAPADLTKALAVIEILSEALQTVSVFQTESQSAEIARQAIAKADEGTK